MAMRETEQRGCDSSVPIRRRSRALPHSAKAAILITHHIHIKSYYT